MNITDPELREDRFGVWTARCKVDGVIQYVTGDRARLWLAEPPVEPARFDRRWRAKEGLRQAVRLERRYERERAERAAREAALAAHPNDGWDPA